MHARSIRCRGPKSHRMLYSSRESFGKTPLMGLEISLPRLVRLEMGKDEEFFVLFFAPKDLCVVLM